MVNNQYLKVEGGIPLKGTVRTQGSKNAALPAIAAALLLSEGETMTFTNVPRLRDTETLVDLLQALGMTVSFIHDTVTVTRSGKVKNEMPARLVQKMRASSILLGPLLAREGHAVMPLPGGCSIGADRKSVV